MRSRNEEPAARRLLVIKPTALGDVAQALQVVPYLKRSGWCDYLAWLVDEAYVDLVRCCPEIDEVVTFPRARWKNRFRIGELRRWAGHLRQKRFDTVLDLQGLARSGMMSLASGASRRIGLRSAREGAMLCYTERVNDFPLHAVDRYAAACGEISGACPVPGSYLSVGKHEALPGPLRAGQYTVLHPYSQRDEKCWPWRHYQNLVKEAPEETFVLCGRGNWFPCPGPNVVDLRNATGLKELIQIIAGSRLLVSTDSGPLHIAAALGRPVIGLFGASLPERTRPRGKSAVCLCDKNFHHQRRSALHHPAVAARAMDSITVATVFSEWRKLASL